MCWYFNITYYGGRQRRRNWPMATSTCTTPIAYIATSIHIAVAVVVAVSIIHIVHINIVVVVVAVVAVVVVAVVCWVGRVSFKYRCRRCGSGEVEK